MILITIDLLVGQVIFDNILNKNIPWPSVPSDMSSEAQDLIDRLADDFFTCILDHFLFLSGELANLRDFGKWYDGNKQITNHSVESLVTRTIFLVCGVVINFMLMITISTSTYN